MSSHIKLPSKSISKYWKDPVTSYSALPSSGILGETRVTLDTFDIWIWNGSSWIKEGNVSGESPTTINALVRWSDNSGQNIKNSTVLLDNSGNLTNLNSIDISNGTNQILMGGVFKTTINAPTPISNRTVTIQDVGIDSNFVLSEGNQTINGDKTFSGNVNLTSLTSNKPLKLDSSKNIISTNLDLSSDTTGVLPVSKGGTNSSTTLNNNKIMISSSGSIVEASHLNDGQILIGSTSGAPIAANISGTTNQINVSNGPGSITLSTPQDINNDANVVFNNLKLKASSNQITLGDTINTKINAVIPTANRIATIPDVGTDSNFILSEGNQIINGNKTFNNPLNIKSTSNQIILGDINTVTLNAITPSSSLTIDLPDVGSNSEVILKHGNQTIIGQKTFKSSLFIEETGSGTNKVEFKTLSGTSNYTISLPTTLPSDNDFALVSNTSGVSSWKGVLLKLDDDKNQTSFNINNNQLTFDDITGATLSTSTSAFILISINITATTNLKETFKILAIKKSSTWDLTIESVGDDSLLNFNLTPTGQLQYTSGNYSGFVSGVLKYRIITT